MNWLINNKEWLLSGVAVAIPLAVLGFLLKKKQPQQKQVIGKNSKGNQAGRDINIGKGK